MQMREVDQEMPRDALPNASSLPVISLSAGFLVALPGSTRYLSVEPWDLAQGKAFTGTVDAWKEPLAGLVAWCEKLARPGTAAVRNRIEKLRTYHVTR